MQLRPSFSLKQQLKQKLSLNTRIIQMFKTYQQSYTDLLSEIHHEVDQNQCLVIERKDQLSGFKPSYASSQNESGLEAYVSADSQHPSLHSYLYQQLELQYLDETDQEIGYYLIDELNDQGFIPHYKTVKAHLIKTYDTYPKKVDDMLALLQSFEPEGVAAENLQDSLCIQLAHFDLDESFDRGHIQGVIQDHFEALGQKDYAMIAKKMGLNESEIKLIAYFIKQNLNPNPGRLFSGDQTIQTALIPSFEVVVEDGEIRLIFLEEEKGISIAVSQHHVQLLDDPNTDDDTRAFLADKMAKAKALVELFENRKVMIKKMVEMIVAHQKLFFLHGPHFLSPLQQSTLVNQLSLSAATVSRLVCSKYIQTPHGLFSLKELCPRSHFGLTKKQLYLMVQDFIAQHPHLSDQKLADLLNKDGIQIARRTVNKYRHLGL